MDPISQNMPQFGEIFEQGKQVSTAATIAVKNAVSDAASSASNQLGIQNEHGGNNPTSQNNQGQLPQGDFLGAVTSESTKELVKDFYAPSDSLAQTSTQTGSSDDLEAQQHLAKLRKELHDEVYLKPLFAYEHKKEPTKADEQAQEDEQEKMAELEQKKQDQKAIPIALKRAMMTTEHRDQGGLG